MSNLLGTGPVKVIEEQPDSTVGTRRSVCSSAHSLPDEIGPSDLWLNVSKFIVLDRSFTRPSYTVNPGQSLRYPTTLRCPSFERQIPTGTEIWVAR